MMGEPAETAESHLEELQAEMSRFWGVHAPHPIADPSAVPPLPPPPLPLFPAINSPPFYLPPLPDLDMEARNIRRTRVCKRCKFATDDAREFLHHQITEHSESVEVHQCDKCDFVTSVYTELVSHKRIHRRTSRRSSGDSDSGLIDDANNNEKQEAMETELTPSEPSPVPFDKQGCLSPPQDLHIRRTPSPVPSPGSPENPVIHMATRNYTCNQCGFKCTSSKTNLRHMVEAHNAVFDIFECDLCDYATRYKHKLPRHRQSHFPKPETTPNPNPSPVPNNGSVFPDMERDENSNQTKSYTDLKTKYAAISQHLSLSDTMNMSGGQLVAAGGKPLSDFGTSKNRMPGINSAISQVPSKPRPACTPVREAVDPAKYVTVHEPDGVKYACSKCGNIYKWRKSLNKHWKEKHDGEIPDPRPNFTPLSIPRIPAKQGSGRGRPSLPPASLMSRFPGAGHAMLPSAKAPKVPNSYQTPSLSQVLKRPPMLANDMTKAFYNPLQMMDAPPDLMAFKEMTRPSLHLPQRKPENVLDLSKKPPSPVAVLPPPKHYEPPQDEPLDFSKKSHKAEAPAQNIKKENDFNFSKFNDFPRQAAVPEQTTSLSLQCPSCAYLGRNKQDYDNHMELHLRKRHYKCAECQQVFFTITELNQHFLESHIDVLYNKAGIPGSQKATESTQLFKYLTMDSTKQLLSCIICGAIFQWQWTLAKHFEQDHPTLPNPYRKRSSEDAVPAEPDLKKQKTSEVDNQCPLCPFSTRSEADMRRHQLKHVMSRKLSCKLCDFEARQRDDLIAHYHSVHPASNTDDITQLTSDPMEDLTQFSASGEITAENTAIVIPQAPEDAPEGSPTSSSKRGKERQDKKVPYGLPFKCNFCEYKARWPSEITQHMKNHSDEKPYLCPRCSYRSKWKWDVVKHLKRCGGGTVEDVIDTTKMTDKKALSNRNVLSNGPPNVTVMPSTKPVDVKSDSSSSAILPPDSADSGSEHMDAATTLALMESKIPEMTGEKSGSVLGQMHYCPHCPFIGHSLTELRRHTRVHSDEKPFICKTCGYSSKWKCDLKKHLRTYNHTSAVPLVYGGHGRKPADWSEDEKNEKMSDEETTLHCSKCSFVAHNQEALMEHSKVHSQKKATPNARLTCKKCSFEATDLSTFLQHKLEHNKSDVASVGSRDSGTEDAAPPKHRRKASKQFRVVHNHSNVDHFDSSEDNSGQDEASFLASSYSTVDSEGEPQDLSMKKLSCSWCDWSSTSIEALVRHARVMHAKNMSREHFESFGSHEYDSDDQVKMTFAESLDLLPIGVHPSPQEYTSPVSPVVIKKDKKKRKLKPCPKCDYVTDNMTTLQRHLSKHGCNGKFTCPYCDYSVDRQHILDYHVKNVHQGPTPTEAFKSPATVTKPTRDLRKTVKKAFKCRKCSLSSVHISKYLRHRYFHQTMQHQCKVCHHKSSSKKLLFTHVIKAH